MHSSANCNMHTIIATHIQPFQVQNCIWGSRTGECRTNVFKAMSDLSSLLQTSLTIPGQAQAGSRCLGNWPAFLSVHQARPFLKEALELLLAERKTTYVIKKIKAFIFIHSHAYHFSFSPTETKMHFKFYKALRVRGENGGAGSK